MQTQGEHIDSNTSSQSNQLWGHNTATFCIYTQGGYRQTLKTKIKSTWTDSLRNVYFDAPWKPGWNFVFFMCLKSLCSCQAIHPTASSVECKIWWQICWFMKWMVFQINRQRFKCSQNQINQSNQYNQLQLTWKTSLSNRRVPKTVMPLLSTTGLLLLGSGLVICFLQSRRRVTFFFCTEMAMRCHLQDWWR